MAQQLNRVIYADLTNGNIVPKELSPKMVKAFIGDGGVSFRLAYDLIRPGTDPLSPENPIIIGAGALTGTRVQAPRWSVVSKWPLTGCVAFGSGGMSFGVRLKQTGYDHLVITGRSPKPVYLKINGDSIEVCDASDLWGKDTYETTDALWEKLGREYSVIAIGQAGENLVRISVALVDKTSSLGKGGLPAIMGSKNLKAIVVRGDKKIDIADQERFDKSCDKLLAIYKADPKLQTWVKLGKLWFDYAGDFRLACRNAREVFPREKYRALYGSEIYLNDIKYQRTGCTTCGYPCKDILKVRKGDYEGLSTRVSSLVGRVWNLGAQAAGGCSFGQVVKLIDVANRYGIDTHQFAPAVMLASELTEKGIMTKEYTEGLNMEPSFETTLTLLDKIAFRQGLGNILADGTPGIIKAFGNKCEEYSTHIKGGEQQMDARSMDFSMAVFSQVTNLEGGLSLEPGHVLQWIYPSKKGYSLDAVREFCHRMDMSKDAIGRIFDKSPGFYNVPRITRYAEDFHIALTALGICEYRTEHLDWGLFAELYSSATGMEMTSNEMKQAGERIWNMQKLLNTREGFGRKDDRFPPKWLKPWTENGKEVPLATCTGEPVSVDTFNKWLDDYYHERGWDIKTGVPTKDKFAALGLGERDLNQRL